MKELLFEGKYTTRFIKLLLQDEDPKVRQGALDLLVRRNYTTFEVPAPPPPPLCPLSLFLITQDGKPSTMRGTPSFGAVESIRLPNCAPGLCAATRARSWG